MILGGRKSFIVASRKGDLSALWSRYGPKIDFGGLYVPPIRATGPVKILVRDNYGNVTAVSDNVLCSEYYGSHLKSYYKINDEKISTILFTPTNLQSTLIILELTNKDKLRNLIKEFYLYLELWGGPLEYDGILPDSINVKLKDGAFIILNDEWSTVLLSNVRIKKYSIDEIKDELLKRASWISVVCKVLE